MLQGLIFAEVFIKNTKLSVQLNVSKIREKLLIWNVNKPNWKAFFYAQGFE